jgi:hypothetical protein
MNTIRSSQQVPHEETKMAIQFRTELLQSGGNTTGIVVPDDVVTALGAGTRPAVTVTINGTFTYRSTIASMSGQFMIPVSAERREAAGIAGGDTIDVTLELDTAPREVEVPLDFAEALALDVAARECWNSLSYSNQLRHVLSIEGAKTPETRQRRLAKVIETLLEDKK